MVTSEYNREVMDRNDDVDEVAVLPHGMSPGRFGSRYTGYDVAVALAPRAVDLQIAGELARRCVWVIRTSGAGWLD